MSEYSSKCIGNLQGGKYINDFDIKQFTCMSSNKRKVKALKAAHGVELTMGAGCYNPGEVFRIMLDSEHPHMAVAAPTGSGLTNLMKSVMYHLRRDYVKGEVSTTFITTSEEVAREAVGGQLLATLTSMEVKGRFSMTTFADSDWGNNTALVTSDLDYIINFLEGAIDVHRQELEAHHAVSYRDYTTKKLVGPRLSRHIMFLHDIGRLLQGRDDLDTCKKRLESIVRKGRSCGVHIVLLEGCDTLLKCKELMSLIHHRVILKYGRNNIMKMCLIPTKLPDVVNTVPGFAAAATIDDNKPTGSSLLFRIPYVEGAQLKTLYKSLTNR